MTCAWMLVHLEIHINLNTGLHTEDHLSTDQSSAVPISLIFTVTENQLSIIHKWTTTRFDKRWTKPKPLSSLKEPVIEYFSDHKSGKVSIAISSIRLTFSHQYLCYLLMSPTPTHSLPFWFKWWRTVCAATLFPDSEDWWSLKKTPATKNKLV